jgi:hypothetical protein
VLGKRKLAGLSGLERIDAANHLVAPAGNLRADFFRDDS